MRVYPHLLAPSIVSVLHEIRDNGGSIGYTKYTERCDAASDAYAADLVTWEPTGQYEIVWFRLTDKGREVLGELPYSPDRRGYTDNL